MTNSKVSKQPMSAGLVTFLLIGGLAAPIIGFEMIANAGNSDGLVVCGLLLIPAGIVGVIIGWVQITRAIKYVSRVKMGAAVKINNMQLRPPVTTPSIGSEISKLTAAHAAGDLSDAEFSAAKAKLLS